MESLDLDRLKSMEWILSPSISVTLGDNMDDPVNVHLNQDWFGLQVTYIFIQDQYL